MGHSSYQVSVCAFNRGKLKVSILQVYGNEEFMGDSWKKNLKNFVSLMETWYEPSKLELGM